MKNTISNTLVTLSAVLGFAGAISAMLAFFVCPAFMLLALLLAIIAMPFLMIGTSL